MEYSVRPVCFLAHPRILRPDENTRVVGNQLGISCPGDPDLMPQSPTGMHQYRKALDYDLDVIT